MNNKSIHVRLDKPTSKVVISKKPFSKSDRAASRATMTPVVEMSYAELEDCYNHFVANLFRYQHISNVMEFGKVTSDIESDFVNSQKGK